MRQRVVGHVVVVQQVSTERLDAQIRTGMLQANFVINAGVIDERIEASEFFDCLLDNGVTALGLGKLGEDDVTRRKLTTQFVGRIGIAIHDYGNCALGGCSADDRSANAFSAAGDQDYFVFELEVQ